MGKKGLTSHMLCHDDDKMVKLWKCIYCDAGKFGRKAELMEHYHQHHDGNIPDELLKPTERQQLQLLLNETDNDSIMLKDFHGSLGSFRPGVDLEESEDDDAYFATPQPDAARSLKSMDSFHSALLAPRSGIVDLILKNYLTRKIPCPKVNCTRFFSREYDLERHLLWHAQQLEKIDKFLRTLDPPMESGDEVSDRKRRKFAICEKGAPDLTGPLTSACSDSYYTCTDAEEDIDKLDEMIDEELKSVRAGGSLTPSSVCDTEASKMENHETK